LLTYDILLAQAIDSKAFDAKIRSVEKRNAELERCVDDANAESDALRLQLEAAQKEIVQLTADAQTKSADIEKLQTRLEDVCR
jgi:hypothetical protein